MDGCQNTEIGPEIGVGLENLQFSENQVDLSSCELFEALSDKKVDLGIDAQDFLPELPEIREPNRAQTNGKYNLRKSLAWDTAFFTSAGVLDAEELSKMITGTGKGEKHVLPIIQEDITASTESFSSLENDTLNMETMEDDLFVDVRASIQRSSRKISNLTNLNDKKAAVEVDSVSVSSLKNEDITSGSPKKNPKPGSKATTVLQTVRSSKSLPKQNVDKQGPRKAIKQDFGRSQMVSTAKLAEKNSVLKTSKPNPNSTSTSAKREPTGLGKSESGSSKIGASGSTPVRRTQPPKVSVLARKMLPKPAVPSKSVLNSSSTGTVQSTRSSTSSDSSSSLSSGATAKSLMARRNPCRSSSTITGPPGSIPKASSKPLLNKKPLSTLSPRLAVTKVSSSVSPASSISDWSSISSSSSSMVNQRFSSSRASQETNSKSTVGSINFLHSRNPSTDRTSAGHNEEADVAGNSSRKTSTTGMTQGSTKPSGLRMPSPKIGFFDGAKPSPRTANGHKQSPSGLRPLLPKNGAAASSPCRTSNNKVKSTKSPKSKTVTSSALKKCDSPKVTSVKSSVDASYSSSSEVKVSASLSHGAKADVTREACQKVEEVHVGVKQEVIAGTSASNVKDSASLSDLAKADAIRDECAKAKEVLDVGVKQEVIACTSVDAIRDECQKANKVHADVGVKQEVIAATGVGAIDNGNQGDLNGTVDIKTSVKSHIIVLGLECSNEIDLVASLNGQKIDSHQIWEATNKENVHKNNLGEHNGDIDKKICSSDASESTLLSEYEASTSAFALKNQFYSSENIEVSAELDAQFGDMIAGREQLM